MVPPGVFSCSRKSAEAAIDTVAVLVAGRHRCAIGRDYCCATTLNGSELARARQPTLWYELGNPGEPQTIEMNFRALIDQRGYTSMLGRSWRYYRAHALRAVSRRMVDEFRLHWARSSIGS